MGEKIVVVVESPAKTKTIHKYLGKDATVLASFGHVRDLIPKEGAVDPDNDFAMHYQQIDRNTKHVKAIIAAAKKADTIVLATDPDREGEAIAWHLAEIIKNTPKLTIDCKRVVFHEITETAVKQAFDHPRSIAIDLVNAQQARRALDFLVGFNLSPLLWKKIQPKLSAGRVQSPALRLIVERELAIEAFKSEEYWTIEARLFKDKDFNGKLIQYQGEKLTQFSVTNEKKSSTITDELTKLANGKLRVSKVKPKQRRRNPAAPFITSTLQQEAARKLGFTAQRTMRTAQQLYEGIDLGDGNVNGLITYMRTDSVTLSKEAVADIRQLIETRYGKDQVPATPPVYKSKAKNAQEAHEAIRPTSASRLPDSVKNSLSSDQHRLYELIWKRTISSQMIHATIATLSVDLACGDDESNLFRATGSTITDPGFMAVYLEGKDDAAGDDDEKLLPNLVEGELITLNAIDGVQHFTDPPPRFTEASLIKMLEEYGIGRPSTYASIISTLVQREYTDLESKRFFPTDIGRVVNKFLTDYFTQYVDYDFTANLENQLDEISCGNQDWKQVLRDFWQPFIKLVKDTDENVSRQEVSQMRELGIDPKSKKPVYVRMGRYGPFAQIGSKDDEDKPKFAGLQKTQALDTITLEEALALFRLPRELGKTPEGEVIEANVGRFGPYVKFGKTYVSTKDEDPYTIELDVALKFIAEKKEQEAKRLIHDFASAKIQVLNGPYGPYVTNGKKNVKIGKDQDPAALTVEMCEEMIANAPEKKARSFKKKRKKT